MSDVFKDASGGLRVSGAAGVVRVIAPDMDNSLSPEEARKFAAQLATAAEEAEMMPRFSEQQLDRIFQVLRKRLVNFSDSSITTLVQGILND